MGAALASITGGVATPRGFRAAGISAGIKASGNPDLMLLVADEPAQVAAVFTTNKVVAAPVVVSREHLARSGGATRAVIVNSGCANACTGDEGMQVARDMAAETVVRLLPPLVITEAEADEALGRLDAALGAVGAVE